MAEELKYKVSIETDRVEAGDLIAPSAIDSLVELNREIEDYRDALRSLKQAEKEQGGLTEEQAVLQERLKGRIKETSGEYQRQQRELVKMSTASNAVGNSYNDLVKQNAALSAAMRALPIDDTTGEMERLRAEYVKNNDELKKFDSAMGNNQRNVGNYQSALDGLGGALKSIPGPIGDIAKMFEMLTKTFGAVTTAVAGKTTVVQGFTAAETGAAVATAAQTTATAAQTAAVGASTAAIGFETAATNTNTAATIGNASAQGVNAAALGGKAAASATATAATGSLTLAQRALNTVMKANPILLVIGLIAGLVSAFRGLQPVMDQIRIVTSAIGAAFGFLRDAVYNFLTGEGELQRSFAETTRLQAELTRQTIALDRARAQLTVTSAEMRRTIARMRLDARDETLPLEERIRTIKDVMVMEENYTLLQMDELQKRIAIRETELSLSRSTREEEQELADMKARLIDLDASMNDAKRALTREYNTLVNKQAADEKAILSERTRNAQEAARERERIAKEQQAIEDAVFKKWAARQQEILAIRDEMDQLTQTNVNALLSELDLDTSGRDQAVLANAQAFAQELAAVEIANAQRTGDTLRALDLQQAEELRQQRLMYLSMGYSDLEASQMAVTDMTLRHAQERADAELAIQQLLSEQQIQNIQNLASTVTSIGTALFGKNKAMAVAQAIIDTYAAANSALKTTPGGPLAKGLAVAAVIAKGLANVRTIMSTNIGSTGTGGTGTTGGNMAGMSVTPAGTLMPTNFRLKGGTDEQGKKEIKDIALDKTTRRLLGKEADRIEAELNLRRRAFYQEQDQQLMSMTNRTFAAVQSMTSLAGEVGASLTAVGADTMQPVNIDASVDERGMAIAVRRGESQIRSQQVVFT